MVLTLGQIASELGAELHGDASVEVSRIANLETAGEGDISFLSDPKYVPFLAKTAASAVLVKSGHLPECHTNALVVNDPYVGFARVAQLLDTTPQPAEGIHPSAVIAEDVVVAEGVSIGANSVIESGVKLAAGVRIGAGCFVGKKYWQIVVGVIW